MTNLPLVIQMKLFALVILSMMTTVANADPWVCHIDQSTGFVFKNGHWQTATFVFEDGKYILRKLNKDDFYYRGENKYGLFGLGTDLLGMPCSEASNTEVFFCGDATRQFNFSTQSGKFLMTFLSGYWESETDDEPDSPQIAIGRCSTI